MYNNAHDDIQLNFERGSKEYNEYRKKIRSAHAGDDLLALLDLLEQMQHEAQSVLEVEQQTVTLQMEGCNWVWHIDNWLLNDTNTPSSFEDLSQKIPVDRDFVEADAYVNLDSELTSEDVNWLAHNNLTCNINMLPYSKSLSELLQDMEMLEIGRPSSISGVLDELCHSGLLQLQNQQVKLTKQGRSVIQVLQQAEPVLASPMICSVLNRYSQMVIGTFYNQQAPEDEARHLSSHLNYFVQNVFTNMPVPFCVTSSLQAFYQEEPNSTTPPIALINGDLSWG